MEKFTLEFYEFEITKTDLHKRGTDWSISELEVLNIFYKEGRSPCDVEEYTTLKDAMKAFANFRPSATRMSAHGLPYILCEVCELNKEYYDEDDCDCPSNIDTLCVKACKYEE